LELHTNGVNYDRNKFIIQATGINSDSRLLLYRPEEPILQTFSVITHLTFCVSQTILLLQIFVNIPLKLTSEKKMRKTLQEFYKIHFWAPIIQKDFKESSLYDEN
jgi:uncharacterized membrane-anchored protein YitT (DUF2179 family)